MKARVNIPRPYEDELLASAWARVGVHLGRTSPKRLLDVVYSDRNALAIPDLPSRLALARPVIEDCWGLSIAEVIEKHTLAPYYLYARPDGVRTRVMEAMECSSQHLHLRLGVCSSGVCRTAFYRLCEDCRREDVKNYGETYWRRAHHLPGVYACAIHGTPLRQSLVPFRALGRHEHLPAQHVQFSDAPALLTQCVDLERAIAVAFRSVALLARPSTGVADLRSELVTCGLIRPGRRCSSLREALLTTVGESLLGMMFATPPEPSDYGFAQVRYSPRGALHPLRRVVLAWVLEGRSAPAATSAPVLRRDFKSRDESLRRRARELSAQGRSTRAIAKTLGVAWKTAERLLQPGPTAQAAPAAPDRREWLSLIAANPAASRTQLRTLNRALYARLYRADRSWLLAQACAPMQRVARLRVDWARRDAELAERLRALIDELRARRPPMRVSPDRIAGELQVRALLSRRAEKLPISVGLLASAAESTEAFQARRIRSVLASGTATSEARTTLLRAARINPARCADGGAKLIASARAARP